MMNEYIFILHCFFSAFSSLAGLYLGPYALTSLIAFQCVLSNVFVLKQVNLFGLIATCADPFTIGATIGFNLMQEYFGKKVARQSIGITFLLLFFYTVATQIHIWYLPAAVDVMHMHYQSLFATTLRIACASLLTYTIVQWLDYVLYGFLKRWFNNRYMHARSFITISTCQAIDTILFTFLGLGSLVANPWDVIKISYGIKLLAIVVSIFFIKIAYFLIKPPARVQI
ncbi:hypothetical protein EKK58_01950 [Candidatus Dependentiae bacterium]|nr:MAG: hypothetical protein EKK58_01950 [Candidatus Dependentiae bacterium]